MFSTTIYFLVAVGFISFVSGLEFANEAAFKCMEAEWRADVSAKQSEEGAKNEDGTIEYACKSLRVRLNLK